MDVWLKQDMTRLGKIKTSSGLLVSIGIAMSIYRESNEIFPVTRDIDDQIDDFEAIGIV
jgi:hypothetical protein